MSPKLVVVFAFVVVVELPLTLSALSLAALVFLLLPFPLCYPVVRCCPGRFSWLPQCHFLIFVVAVFFVILAAPVVLVPAVVLRYFAAPPFVVQSWYSRPCFVAVPRCFVDGTVVVVTVSSSSTCTSRTRRLSSSSVGRCSPRRFPMFVVSVWRCC
jgi:hypothetical protein